MALTEKQKLACRVKVEKPDITNKALADRIGVHFNSITKWFKKPEVIAYKDNLSFEVHREHVNQVLKTLRERALTDEDVPNQVKYMELLTRSMGLLNDKSTQHITYEEKPSDEQLLKQLEE